MPFSPETAEIGWLSSNDHAWVMREAERAMHRHLHLDWQILPEMLRADDFRCRVVRQDGRIHSGIGVTIQTSPHHTERVAWLRLILPGGMRSDRSLDRLWDTLSADLRGEGVSQVALLALDPWVETPAARWRFERTNSVITLRRMSSQTPPLPQTSLRIRNAVQDDLDNIAALDAMAFELCWHHNRIALETAWKQAATFTVAESCGELLGYQLSTWHIDTGHLARLAVRPDHQGKGLGILLVSQMLRFFADRGVSVITVNTQADNIASQRLYRRLGFEPVNHSVAFWSLALA